MNDTTANIPRLLDLGRWLTKEERKRRLGQRSEWNQSYWVHTKYGENVEKQDDVIAWSCGTAACAAGHIALEDGGLPAFYNSELGRLQPFPHRGDVSTISDSTMFFGGRSEAIDEHAAAMLGLDDDQQARLFDGDNDWDAMFGLIAEFTGYPEGQLVLLLGAQDMPADPDDDDYEHCDCGCEDDD